MARVARQQSWLCAGEIRPAGVALRRLFPLQPQRARLGASALQAAFLTLILTFGLSPAASFAAEPAPACEQYAASAVRVGTEPAELAEDSGMVVGHGHPDVFWTHNDSGNPFELFAQRLDGTIAARFPLTGGENVDMEDIAAGPCLDDRKRWCIYLADIGDNTESRKEVAIYQVVEPELLDGAALAARKLRFTYADRPHNAETLLVDPRSVELFVITKESAGLGSVYRLDGLAPGKIGRAVPLRRLEQASGFSVLTTAGDVHPSGTRVLLRTYTGVFEYRGHSGESLDTILGTVPVTVTGAPQPQPESIAYTADGRSYVVGSELPGTAIFRVDCAR